MSDSASEAAPVTICGFCKLVPAQIQCQECVDPDPGLLCPPCDAQVHKQRSKSKHVRSSLVASGGKFFKDFGARGRNLLQFQGPSGVAIYEDNNLMVICDQSNHRIQAFHTGTMEGIWYHGELLQPSDAFTHVNFPRGCAFSVDFNLVYVADSANHRISVLRADTGRCVYAFGTPGTSLGQFSYPWAVAPYKSRLWVSDWNNNRAQCFNAVDGTYVRSLGQAVVGGSTARDGLNQPTGIVCYDGRVFIADSQNHRVQVYREESGIHLMCVGKGKGAGEGQLNLPMGLAIDPTTRLLYVCECGNRRVTVFSSENYSFRAFLGEPGNGQGQFQKPESVCVDSTNNFVYVTDNYLNRVLVFNTVK